MPEVIAWTEAYAIGDPDLDAQHRELFRLAAAVTEIADPASQLDELRDILHRLYRYMEQHFEAEERYMAELGYPDLERHRGLHRALIEAMNDIMKSSGNLMQLQLSLVELMNRWLSEHIVEEDRQIAAAARAAKSPTAAEA